MLESRHIQELGERIERAYLRRHPRWRGGCAGPEIWRRAAELLCELNESNPEIPIDPELYVAAQAGSDNPLLALTLASSVDRYRRRVRKIIRVLRSELRREVLRAERQLDRGMAVETVLLPSNDALSPLGCFIVAHRAGRPELASHFHELAGLQHQGCPLYGHVCRSLLPPAAQIEFVTVTQVAAAESERSAEAKHETVSAVESIFSA